MRHNFLISSTVLLWVAACMNHEQKPVQGVENVPSVTNSSLSKYSFPYDLDHPEEKVKLPDELIEISGIDVYRKSKLVCEQDEKGNIYIYNVDIHQLEKTIPFGKDGDYEGIANVNDTIYVMKSDGKLYQVTDLDTPQQKTTEYRTFLQKENNTEGLCFDKKNRRLLIACKNDPGSGLKDVRAIYAFDLKTMSLQSKPVYAISLDAIKSYISKVSPEEFSAEEMRDILDPAKGDVAFQPSDLAIHPISGDIYVIATVGKIMVILHPNGTIAYIKEISPDVFKQPEGITFFDDGTMYISDEGRNGKANILRFKYRPK